MKGANVMMIPYGYLKDINGGIRIDEEKAKTVRLIFNLYLEGLSLNRIAAYLFHEKIASPSGKEKWTVQAIDNLLSNQKYTHIVSPEIYVEAQLEKQKRTNQSSAHKRKTVRYNSNDVLSGLLVCGECGRNYRRITRKDGNIVWRCADRVDNGRQATCQNIYTISEVEIKNIICNYLEIEKFDDVTVKNHLERIEITRDKIILIPKLEHLFDIHL